LAGPAQLQTLKLSGCRQITDAGLAHVAGLAQLQTLYLYACEQITETGKQLFSESVRARSGF
jgi:hypothetical protein